MNIDIQYILHQRENGIAEFKTSFSEEIVISREAFSNAKGVECSNLCCLTLDAEGRREQVYKSYIEVGFINKEIKN